MVEAAVDGREVLVDARVGLHGNLPTGVGTVLVVDVAAATDGEPAAAAGTAHPEVQPLFDQAVETYDGRALDATTALFGDAVSAVRAAIGMQRNRGDLPTRAGLASGELTGATGDGLEPLVDRAAAVCDRAQPGEVYLDHATASLVRPELPVWLVGMSDGPEASSSDGVVAIATVGVNSPPDPNRVPYPGLAAFGQADADLFFGREAIVERCLELLRAERFVAVVGPAGSGKSSVALAGIASQLPAVVVPRPGEHPLQELAASGAADRPDALLVVDQLEDVVTCCRSQPERAAFIDAIVDHPGGLVVTIRADEYGEFAPFAELAELLSSGQVLLGPLDHDALTRVVVEPARRCGLAVADELPELIAAELDLPFALPRLGHALRESWLRKDGSTITVAGYQQTGGVRSAIEETGERTFLALDAADQAVARRLLPRMVEWRRDGNGRRLIGAAEITEVEPNRSVAVLAAFTAAGLVVVDDGQSTFAHDAVPNAWPRLAEWIDDDRAAARSGRRPVPPLDRVRQLQLAVVATSLLAVVALIAGVVAFVERNDANRERDAAQLAGLVAESRAAAIHEPDEALLLAARAHATAATPATAGALVDALLARPSAYAMLQGAPSTVQAIAVAEEDVMTTSGNEVLRWAQDSWRRTAEYSVGASEIADVALSEDGETLLVAVPDDHVLHAVDAASGRPAAEPVRYGVMRPVQVVAAGDRALVLVNGGSDSSIVPRVVQHDLRTFERSGPSLVPPASRLQDVVGVNDGRRAVLATLDGRLWLADPAPGGIAQAAAAPADGTDAGIVDIAVHDDLLVAGRLSGRVDVWRVDSGGTLNVIGRHDAGGPVEAVAAGCDGSCLAAGTADGRVVAWRVGSEQLSLDAPAAHDGQVNDVEFTADGTFVVSAGDDGMTLVHALDGSVSIARSVTSAGSPARGAYDGNGGILRGIDDPDRGRITRYAENGEVTWRTSVGGAVSWLAAADRRIIALVAPAGESTRFVVLDAGTGRVALDRELDATEVVGALAPDGSTVVLAAREGSGSSVVTVDVDTLAATDPAAVDDVITALTFAPDGTRIVTGHATGDVAVRALESFASEFRSEWSAAGVIGSVGLTPDGDTVIAGDAAGFVHVLEATSLDHRFDPLAGHRDAVTGVAARDDVLLTASVDGTARLWDVASGAAIGGPIPTGGTTTPTVTLRDDHARALLQSDRGLLELVLDDDEWVRLACFVAGREAPPVC